MPRPKAPCGTFSAYKRHLRDGEPVDEECRRASSEQSAEYRAQRKAGVVSEPAGEVRETPEESRNREERLRWQLSLLESAMAHVAANEPSKLAPLAKRHSELLTELAGLDAGEKEVDPFDEFFSGDVSNVSRFPTSKDREAS